MQMPLSEKSFLGCKYLKKVVIPEGVKSGKGLSFYDCKNIKLYLALLYILPTLFAVTSSVIAES